LATQYHNLSDYDPNSMPDASAMKVGIVVAEWNYDITSRLKDGAVNTLLKNGVKEENIFVQWVPGSFELVFGARAMAALSDVDAVIILGCVIRGETPHFDYICSGVTQGITQLNLTEDIPFVFGLLTNENMQQSIDRAGGIHGNKGDEAAVTAIKMIALNAVK
jgi:6,7-dimethyl-8-ribityllumazine synthase